MSHRGRGFKRIFDHASRTQTTVQSTVQVANATIYLNERDKVVPRYNQPRSRGRPRFPRGGYNPSTVHNGHRNSDEHKNRMIDIPEELKAGLPPNKLTILERKLTMAHSETEENRAFTRAYEELAKVHQSREALQHAKQAAIQASKKIVKHHSPLQNVYPDGKSTNETSGKIKTQQRKTSDTKGNRSGGTPFQSKKCQDRLKKTAAEQETQDTEVEDQLLADTRLKGPFSDILDEPQNSPMETQQVS